MGDRVPIAYCLPPLMVRATFQDGLQAAIVWNALQHNLQIGTECSKQSPCPPASLLLLPPLSSLPPFTLFSLSFPPSLPPFPPLLFPLLPSLLAGIHSDFVEQPPHSRIVFPGQTVVLQCQPPESNPPAVVHWKKDNHPITPDNDRVILTQNGYLYIKNTSDSDSGMYQCIADNSITGARRRSDMSNLLVFGE